MHTEHDINKELERAAASVERRILHGFGYFGHYLHQHAGGRGGKQHVLVKLLRNEGHLTQRALQESTNISSAALSEVLAKLECEGLVRRTRSAQDKRQLDISLTPEGQHVALAFARRRVEFERQAFEPLSSEERAQLADTLARLVQHWKRIEEQERGTNANG